MSSGQHQRLDYKDMSYWAKQNVRMTRNKLLVANLLTKFFQALGNSDKYNPPNAITLDHRSKRSRANPRSGPSASGPEIHIHLDGLGDALRYGGSVPGNHKNTDAIESVLSSNSGM